MENVSQDNTELRELRGLIERVKRGVCVLVLGPRVAIRPNDPERIPLDELLSAELLANAGVTERDASLSTPNLRRAADLYFRSSHDREDLELAVQDVYRRETGSTTDFHRDLARLPFGLCISASPDNLMLTAFKEANKSPQKGYYNFKQATDTRLPSPTPEMPLVYFLFGHHEDASSLVLTESDLIEFLVSIVRGAPPLPDQVRSILADSAVSFLFLGFGFHNWYLRVLLQVMNVYGHRSKAIAFEDTQFFDHPEHEQAVGFFSGERQIDFRPLRWEAFARSLREAYEAVVPPQPAKAPSIHESPLPNLPKAFLSYASEDLKSVQALGEQLEAKSINVWQDKKNLRAGDYWNDVLMDTILGKVDYFIVVQTPAMVGRIQGVFHREIEKALQRQAEMGEFNGHKLTFVIPVKIGDCALLSSLHQHHVIDVSDPNGIALLVDAIQEDWNRRAALTSRSRGGG